MPSRLGTGHSPTSQRHENALVGALGLGLCWKRGGDRAERKGRIVGVALVYLVQHGEKEPLPGDPGLTNTGRQQAACTGRWLRSHAVRVLYSSPLRRALETAECIAAITGLSVQPDARLRERLNWDGSEPFGAFLALWQRTTQDRDFVPAKGDSSRRAAARLRAFLAGLPGGTGPVVAVTHGGVTTDLLRSLLGDDALPPHVLHAGIPGCAITALDDLNAVMIASTAHLV
jgi:broad specificity phosphatase PhoE